jgi:hypothetical protein
VVKPLKQEETIEMKSQNIFVNQVTEKKTSKLQELESWLEEIGLRDLLSVLVELGADGMDSLAFLKESDLEKKGVPSLKARKLLREVKKSVPISNSILDIVNNNANTRG